MKSEREREKKGWYEHEGGIEKTSSISNLTTNKMEKNDMGIPYWSHIDN